jgi:hypothetical protein
MQWFLHACPVCGGDLHEDIEDKGWVLCFMCARSFKLSEIRAVAPAPQPVAAGQVDDDSEELAAAA